MTHFVIVYASREGQTQKVAHHVAKQVENLGHLARLINVGDDEPDAMVGEFDAAIIAGDLDNADRASALAEFVREHGAALKAVPSALLTVTLEAGAKDKGSRDDVQSDIDTFEAASKLRPDRALAVGGAFHDRGHGGFMRAWRHVWMYFKGITPDPSGHTELTDWPALETFVRDFVANTASGKLKKKTSRKKPAAKS